MPNFIQRHLHRLPLSFRVLFRQFLLRVIDLESLSIEADIPRFLGQFAALLLFFSFIRAAAVLFLTVGNPLARPQLEMLTWHLELQFTMQMFFVAGITSVLIWDAVFPDKRDVMVLAPLPIRPQTILQAKLASSCAVLGIAIIALNILSITAWSFFLSILTGNYLLFPAIWIAILAISLFVYGCILALQGAMSLLLPRRWFLQLSSLLQIAAFGYFLVSFFMTPGLNTPDQIAAPANRLLINSTPAIWFFALLRQMSNSLDPQFGALASHAWIALLAAVCSAGLILFCSYQHILRKTLETPDLQPSRRHWHWPFGKSNALAAVILRFSVQSVMRSRQHRLALAVYVALIGAIALSLLRNNFAAHGPRSLDANFLIASLMMMALAVIGLRSIFSLPISLAANWVLRVTQVRSTAAYIHATRVTLATLAVFPVFVLTSVIALGYRPLQHVAVHLTLLLLAGLLITELNVANFRKVPFTCSYLPGKISIQWTFCVMMLLLVGLSVLVAKVEQPALNSGVKSTAMISVLLFSTSVLLLINHQQSRSAEICFEDQYPIVITTLDISTIKPLSP